MQLREFTKQQPEAAPHETRANVEPPNLATPMSALAEVSHRPDSCGGVSAVNRSGRGVGPLYVMTVVEMVVALTVACILMVAVVSFLVNGVVSTTKTTAMNDTTTRGRYVFEHMSKELAQADDLKSSNFTTANPNNAAAFSGFNYRINLGGTPTVTTSEFLDKHYVDVTFNVAGYLKPVAGDFLQLPSPTLGADPGTAITGVSQTGPDQYKLTVSDSLANLSGQPVTNQVGQNEVAVIRRQRTYMIDSVTGTT